MSLLKLVQPGYYFENFTESTFTGFWVVFGLAVVALGASVWLRRKAKAWSFEKREITLRITGPVFVASWLMMLWMFFRYEGIIYLSWRFWPALIFIYLAVSAVLLWRWVKLELPKRKERAKSGDDTKQHYLRRFTGQGRAGGSKKK